MTNFEAPYKPMTAEEKFAVIQQNKNFVTFPLCGGHFEKGDQVIVGNHLENIRLATIARVYQRSILTECGLKFNHNHFGQLSTEDGLRMFSVDTTYQWLNTDLPLDDILLYLTAKYGCDSYQYGGSIALFNVFGFREGWDHPVEKFAVYKQPRSALTEKRVELLDAYVKKEFPGSLIVRFEDVRAWLDARAKQTDSDL
ncbi:MAG TPA: hypothetical protein V6D29_13245 [Leptolyngbyaceae cyanobacterium]